MPIRSNVRDNSNPAPVGLHFLAYLAAQNARLHPQGNVFGKAKFVEEDISS